MQRPIPRSLLAASLICAGLGAAAQPIEVTTATQLRAAPALDATVLMPLAPGARVERTSTQGGWVKVRSAEREGWVRLTHVKLPDASPRGTAPNPVTGVGGMFSATSNTPTATTGARGMPLELKAGSAEDTSDRLVK